MSADQPNTAALSRDAVDEGQRSQAVAGASTSASPHSSTAASESSQYRAPIKHSMRRRKIGHDYTKPYAYLITIDTTNRERLLGTLAGDSPDTAHIVPTELGQAVIAYFRNIERYVMGKTGCRVQVLQYQLMPEHFHGILRIHDELPESWHLGKIIAGWKGTCSRAYWGSTATLSRGAVNEGQRGTSAASSLSSTAASNSSQSTPPLFSNGYNDRPLYGPGQLEGWIAYLRDNPRRRWLKQHFPDRLRKVYNFKAGESGTSYTAVGDTFALTYPERQQVRCHRNLTPEQIQAEVEHYMTLTRQGVVLISPFISPAERAVYEACYEEKRRMVKLVKRALDGRFVYPQGRDFDACAEGFLLVLSPFMTGSEQAAEKCITRDQCLSLNDYAADLASSSARRITEAYNGRVPAYLSLSPNPLSSAPLSSTAVSESSQPNPSQQ